jgi:hypothetical protein
MPTLVAEEPGVKWFHVLTDPRTGNTYPTVKSMPDHVLEWGTTRVMEALRRNHSRGNVDTALDCYNAWKQELARRNTLMLNA